MDSGVVAYQMTISHLPFLGGKGTIYRKSRQQCVTLYALESTPPLHTCFLYPPVNSTLEENRAIYMCIFRLRVTVTLHPAILTTGTLFKPMTGEWQQTMTECPFSIVRPRKMIHHSPPRQFANKLLRRVLSWSNCSVHSWYVPMCECVFVWVCMHVCICVCVSGLIDPVPFISQSWSGAVKGNELWSGHWSWPALGWLETAGLLVLLNGCLLFTLRWLTLTQFIYHWANALHRKECLRSNKRPDPDWMMSTGFLYLHSLLKYMKMWMYVHVC